MDWQSVEATDVAAIRSSGDARALQRFIGDVAMGDSTARGGGDPRGTHALVLLQLQLQYLIYSHQALRQRVAEGERRLGRAERREAAAKLRAQDRKERVRSLASEGRAQEEVMASYVALLEGDDPQLAATIAWTETGHLVETARPERSRPAGVELLRWDGDQTRAAGASSRFEGPSGTARAQPGAF